MDKPLILSLDAHGVPHRWISWQQACFYYAKNLVAWTLGDETFTYYGGISRTTGERSSITAHSIVAIKGKALAAKGFNQVPPLNNRELFRRDRHMCAYCGGEFSYFRLTRDHITPLSRGGRDTWMNVVCACRHCNGHARNRLPQECGLEPPCAVRAEQGRVPDLTNRCILAEGGVLKQHVVALAAGSRPRLIFGVTAVSTARA
jgi:hypothetical protein